MPVIVVTGLQWGDEGKGKMVDHLAESALAVARFSGGANAGHTVVVDGRKIVLHQIPCGIIRPGVIGIIGASCVVDPVSLISEIKITEEAGISIGGRLAISGKAHLVHPGYKFLEKADEEKRDASAVGTTGRGIGPTYTQKFMRMGIRLEDACIPSLIVEKADSVAKECADTLNLSSEDEERLQAETREFIEASQNLVEHAGDVSLIIQKILDNGKTLIAEGAQGSLLDPDHGTYPYVTCGSCIAGAAGLSLGFGPTRISEVVGILKAYTTRVGNGPFPTELTGSIGERIREQGNEYGATTGRPRRCGWFDGVLSRYTARINGSTWITLTLLDVLSGLDELKVCTRYELDPEIEASIFETGARLGKHTAEFETLPGWQEDIMGEQSWDSLPVNARNYVEFLEDLVGVHIKAVSTGPDRKDLIWRN